MKQIVVLLFLFCLQVTAGQSQAPDGSWRPRDLEGTWIRNGENCGGSFSPSKKAVRITLKGIPNGTFTMLMGPTPSGFAAGVIAYQSPYSIKAQSQLTILEASSTTTIYGQGVENEAYRGKVDQLPRGSTYEIALEGGGLTLTGSFGSCKTGFFRKASSEEIAAIDKQIVSTNPNLASLLSSSDGNPDAERYESVTPASTNAQQSSNIDPSQKLALDQQNASFFQTQLQSAQTQACYGNGTTAAVCNGLKAANIGRLQAALDQANAQVNQDQLNLNAHPDSSASSPRSGASVAGKCSWSNDFNLIRDPEMLNTLKNQNFSQKLAQGGQPIGQQIAAGEAALQQITNSLPNIETAIRGISSPPLNHFNFQFDYVATCKQNRSANQGTALLAEMCQHVNVENTRYALNGTLQIMDCMAGRQIRADIGPNQNAPVVAADLPPDVRSAVVPAATNNCDVHTSGDTYSPPPDPNCPHVSRPGDPKPGDKITH